MPQRLQKIMSQLGIASRRRAEELILNKKVLVNNKIAKLGDKVEIEKDVIKINNKTLKSKEKLVYYLVNKPKDYTCSVADKHAHKLITQLVPAKPKVWPVGRLDKNSSGLIILTNDGDLTQQLTHPKFGHPKEYQVKVNKKIIKEFLDKMVSGVKLDEGTARADKIQRINNNSFLITIHQGWKRQIRRMSRALDYRVVELKRIRVGKIKLGKLKEGEYKKILNPNF